MWERYSSMSHAHQAASAIARWSNRVAEGMVDAYCGGMETVHGNSPLNESLTI